MTISITQTNLSDYTLDAISLTAQALAEHERLIPKYEAMLFELAELAFSDAELASRKDYSYTRPERLIDTATEYGEIVPGTAGQCQTEVI